MARMGAVATRSTPPHDGAARVIAGRYALQTLLGRGGAGEVWRVRDGSTGKHLALKMLRPGASAKQVALFEREYHTLAGLRHPHIIEVYDYGTPDERPINSCL
jgi:eukaryotic-like serine/threonine-protein kinase